MASLVRSGSCVVRSRGNTPSCDVAAPCDTALASLRAIPAVSLDRSRVRHKIITPNFVKNNGFLLKFRRSDSENGD